MSPSYDPWSGRGAPTFDFSDRLRDQAAIRLEELADPVHLPPEALEEPTSWSRAEDRPVTLRELVAAHYPATAQRFSIEPLQADPDAVLRVTQLSDQEFVKLTRARLDHGIHDLEDLPGVVFASYPPQLLKNELEFETPQGAQIVGMVAQRLALLETRLAVDRVYPG